MISCYYNNLFLIAKLWLKTTSTVLDIKCAPGCRFLSVRFLFFFTIDNTVAEDIIKGAYRCGISTYLLHDSVRILGDFQ